MTKDEVRDLLPKVGERRMEVPTILKDKGYHNEERPCVVVYVNRKNMWYTVQFENGIRESYKLPRRGGGTK